MYYLVAYVCNPTGAQHRGLKRLFGAEYRPSALPVVSPPFETVEAATKALQEIRQFILDDRDNAVLVQPAEEHVPRMLERAALQLVKDDADWSEFLENFRVTEEEVQVTTREYGRCWSIVGTVGMGIPPGTGFVVDKFSKRVFRRRYIDLVARDPPADPDPAP